MREEQWNSSRKKRKRNYHWLIQYIIDNATIFFSKKWSNIVKALTYSKSLATLCYCKVTQKFLNSSRTKKIQLWSTTSLNCSPSAWSNEIVDVWAQAWRTPESLATNAALLKMIVSTLSSFIAILKFATFLGSYLSLSSYNYNHYWYFTIDS